MTPLAVAFEWVEAILCFTATLVLYSSAKKAVQGSAANMCVHDSGAAGSKVGSTMEVPLKGNASV